LAKVDVTECPTMKIIEELEAEFSAMLTRNDSETALIRLQNKDLVLTNLALGADFVAGVDARGLTLVPVAAICKVIAKVLPVPSSVELGSLLARQRNPVRVEYRDGQGFQAGWLLSIQAPWLRIAAEEGVVWVPVTALSLLRIQTVENL